MNGPYTIRTQFERVSSDICAAFCNVSTSQVGDAMGRMDGLPLGIHRIAGAGSVSGPAFTVRTRPDDNLMAHAAIDLAQPGDIIVIAAGGRDDVAIIGELMTAHAKARGIAAFVVDGAVRDADALAVPVFARSVCPRGPFKSGPGTIGSAVSIGGSIVHAGDLVLADGDGVAIVGRENAPDVLARAQAIAAREHEALAAIAEGTWPRDWVRVALAAAGVQ